MRIRPPKPLHGWRAFAGEVGVIVLGVLIALGAQESVQSWSDDQQAVTAISALKAEIAGHVKTTGEIEVVAPCINAQIDAIEAHLNASDKPLPRFTDVASRSFFVLRMPRRGWSDGAWESVKSVDTLRRQKPALADQIYRYYAQLSEARQTSQQATELNSRLNALAVATPADAAERLNFIELAELLRSDVGVLDVIAGQLRYKLARARLLDEAKNAMNVAKDSGT